MSGGEEKKCSNCAHIGIKPDPARGRDWSIDWCFRINDTKADDKICKDHRFKNNSLDPPEVLGFFKRKGEEDRKFNTMLVLQLFIVIVMFATVGMSYKGYQVQVDTQKIVAESSIPNKADLVIFTTTASDNLTFSREVLATKYMYGAHLFVGIRNQGRFESGRINMWWNSTSNSSFKIWDSYDSIPNLEGGEKEFKMLGIKCSECLDYYGEHPDEKLNETLINLVPKGRLELELIVECPQCPPDQHIITPEPFKICLYDEPEECESF